MRFSRGRTYEDGGDYVRPVQKLRLVERGVRRRVDIFFVPVAHLQPEWGSIGMECTGIFSSAIYSLINIHIQGLRRSAITLNAGTTLSLLRLTLQSCRSQC